MKFSFDSISELKGKERRRRSGKYELLVTPNQIKDGIKYCDSIAMYTYSAYALKINEKQNWFSMTTDVFVY